MEQFLNVILWRDVDNVWSNAESGGYRHQQEILGALVYICSRLKRRQAQPSCASLRQLLRKKTWSSAILRSMSQKTKCCLLKLFQVFLSSWKNIFLWVVDTENSGRYSTCFKNGKIQTIQWVFLHNATCYISTKHQCSRMPRMGAFEQIET